jgi:hypothetical protein
MDTAHGSIRKSVLSTLQFLASEEKQRAFASEVSYASYHDEFAQWWFDTFLADDPAASRIFGTAELPVLLQFSQRFARNLETIGDGPLSLDELHQTPEWQSVVADARAACAQLRIDSSAIA